MFGERIKKLIGEAIDDDQPAPPARELTIDEAVEIAVQLQRIDQLEGADEIYTRVLADAPDHPRALHYAGVLAHQLGRKEQAVSLIERSLALAPDEADWHNNFGIVLQEQDRLDDAINEYRRAIELSPEHVSAYSNIGVLLRAKGRFVEAEEAYRTAIGLNSKHIEAYNNLGILLNGLGRTQEAVLNFCKVITLRPKHTEARRLLALAHCTLGEVDKATAIFEEWLADDPNDPIAAHMLAACSGREVPPRASDAFVSRTFDTFASSFESKLGKLSYRAPALVHAMLEDAEPTAEKRFEILDAGCGTGLCGPLVAPYARHLVGVDLSGGMLMHARDKGVYDELLQGELTEFLRLQPGRFDIIVSADTLVYFGPLEDVVAAAAGALRPGGLLIFTLERANTLSTHDFHLELHGRYGHTQAYARRVLESAGLTAEIAEADLRTESGAPVGGMVIRARKGAAQ